MCKIPVVFTFTDNFIVPAYIAIRSLIESAASQTEYDIIVLHYDLSIRHMQVLKKLVLSSRHNIRLKKVSKEQLEQYPESDKWPHIVYVRLFLPDILKQYKKVIYSDVDVLFMGDLQSLYNLDIKAYEWGGVPAAVNKKDVIQFRYFENNKNQYIYQSGFMLCNLEKMREMGFSNIVRDNIKKYGSDLLMFDLDILNMSTTKILNIPIRYSLNAAIYKESNIRKTYEYSYLKDIYSYRQLKCEKEKVIMVHYSGGRGKPWAVMLPPQEYVQYLKKMPLRLKLEHRRDRYIALGRKLSLAWRRKN